MEMLAAGETIIFVDSLILSASLYKHPKIKQTNFR